MKLKLKEKLVVGARIKIGVKYAKSLRFGNLKTVEIMTLENKHVSIKYFDSEGIDIVSTVTGIDVETIEFELETGNHLISQAESGNFYFFCETDEVENEITFYEFLVRLRDFKPSK